MAKNRKSDNTPWIIAGIVAAAALGYFWLKQQLDLIQVGGITSPFQQLDGTRIRLTIRLTIVNASAISARITGFTGFILSPTGTVISTVFLNRPASIPSFAQSDLDFTSYIGAADLAGELYKIISSGQKPDWKGYKLKGQLRVFGFPVPIETALV